jgi:hypothetical protein
MVRRFTKERLFKKGAYLNWPCIFRFVSVTILLWFCVAFSPAQQSQDQVTLPSISGLFVKSVPGAPFSGKVEIVSRQKVPDGSVYVLK